jgi:hypothetical protein
VQLVAATRTDGQLLVLENTPDVAIINPLIGLPPKLVTVIVWGELLVGGGQIVDNMMQVVSSGSGLTSGLGAYYVFRATPGSGASADGLSERSSDASV